MHLCPEEVMAAAAALPFLYVARDHMVARWKRFVAWIRK
jgi:hypothetical protein